MLVAGFKQNLSLGVSVVIAYRNESKHLERLFYCLEQQCFKGGLEYILVNDHSEDTSLQMVENWNCPYLKKSLSLPKGIFGKKQALLLGAQNASNELLVFTDADCILERNWLSSLVNSFDPDTKMICGPFLYQFGAGWISAFQILEQSILFFFSYIMGKNKKAVMCNGANLAIRKETYFQIVSEMNFNEPSGDDIFMLFAVKKKFREQIKFVSNVAAVVYGHTLTEGTALLNQKMRWVSKIGKYKDFDSIIFGFISMLYLFFSVILLMLGEVKFFLFKISLEFFVFYIIYLIFYKNNLNSRFFNFFFCIKIIISIAVYPFYSIFVLLFSRVKRFEWKGRIYL